VRIPKIWDQQAARIKELEGACEAVLCALSPPANDPGRQLRWETLTEYEEISLDTLEKHVRKVLNRG